MGIHMDRGRVGEERGSKETDGCPLTLPPFKGTVSRRVRIARPALVKRMESKMAALIWHTVPGCLQWNCAIFDFACS
jgi:hypothetical protein